MVWVSGSFMVIVYMNIQDMVCFVVVVFEWEEIVCGIYLVVGFKVWNIGELVQFCECCSGKIVCVFWVQFVLMNLMQGVVFFFEFVVNVVECLVFVEVIGSGQILDVFMQNSYVVFGFEVLEIMDMEGYIGEYYDMILKCLCEMEVDFDKDVKKKLFF